MVRLIALRIVYIRDTRAVQYGATMDKRRLT